MIKAAEKPIWANSEHSAINLQVHHAHFGVIPFTASPSDCEKHGRDLYAAALAGEFGEIAEYKAEE